MAERVRFPIDGMTCTSCAGHVTKAVRRIDGVESVKVDLGSDSVAIGFDPARTSLAEIADAITAVGYAPHIEEAAPFVPEARRGVLSRLGLR